MPNQRPPDNYTKTCSRCRVIQPASAYHTHPGSRDGLQGRCKTCQNEENAISRSANPEKYRAAWRSWHSRQPKEALAARARKWRANNRERAKDRDLKNHLGVPIGTYDQLLAQQAGKCAICRSEKPKGRGRFHLDHCHGTGAIRGLLCHHCNLLMGHANDDPNVLLAAVEYLAKYQPSIR